MGTLEPEFYRLHWPPLVRSVRITKQYPGYSYEFFETFQELDKYFTEHCGPEWQSQAWAKFWINQHLQTKNDDRKEQIELTSTKPRKNTGPRRDTQEIFELCKQYLESVDYKVSSRKLAAHLRNHDINITHMTAWRIIKELRLREQRAKGL
jgi:hypothetical protein